MPLERDPVLRGLVAEALSRRSELKRDHAALEASRARAPQATTLPDPSLSLGIQNDGFRQIQIGRMETSWLYFVASQTFPWFGKRALRQGLVETQVKQEEAGLARTELAIRAEVTRAYLDLLLARDELDVLGKIEALWIQGEGAARARYETGEGAQSDLLRAQLERSRLKLRRWAAEAEEARRLETLNSLRGAPAEASLATPLHLMDLEDPEIPAVDGALEEAESRSPELKRASLQKEQARQARELAGKDYLPDVTVTAGVMPRGGLEPMWQAGLSFAVPVWSGQRQHHLVREKASMEEAAAAEKDNLSRALAARVRERIRTLRVAVESNKLSRSGILIQSEATMTSTLAQFRVGRVAFTAVLEALASYVNDVESYLQSLVTAERLVIGLDELSFDAPASSTFGASSATMSSASKTAAGASASPAAGDGPSGAPGRGNSGAMPGGM